MPKHLMLAIVIFFSSLVGSQSFANNHNINKYAAHVKPPLGINQYDYDDDVKDYQDVNTVDFVSVSGFFIGLEGSYLLTGSVNAQMGTPLPPLKEVLNSISYALSFGYFKRKKWNFILQGTLLLSSFNLDNKKINIPRGIAEIHIGRCFSQFSINGIVGLIISPALALNNSGEANSSTANGLIIGASLMWYLGFISLSLAFRNIKTFAAVQMTDNQLNLSENVISLGVSIAF
jgi:hypothetical protein